MDTYGTHPVWQMYDNHREPVGFVRYTWKEALKLKGASQLIHLKNLILSRPYFGRVPDQSLLISPKAGDEHICCTINVSYTLIYLPLGGEVEIKTNDLKWDETVGWWFDPRTGESELIGKFKMKDKVTFTAPGKGRENDWVLVLDDSSAKFAKPGIII